VGLLEVDQKLVTASGRIADGQDDRPWTRIGAVERAARDAGHFESRWQTHLEGARRAGDDGDLNERHHPEICFTDRDQ